MKRSLFLFVLMLAVPALAVGQAQTRERMADDPATGSPVVRDRVVGSTHAANHVEKQKPKDKPLVAQGLESKTSNSVNLTPTGPKWGNTAVVSRSDPDQRMAQPANPLTARQPVDQGSQSSKKLVHQTSLVPALAGNSPGAGNASSPKSMTARGSAPTVVYHVGVGDVLDIRLTNLPTKESTLFTVLKNGLLEYPLLSGPLPVAGMTTDEIARLLSDEIKVIKAARVSVSVRDFTSHAVVVTGLVDSPGRKTMRREAMPLFAVLAEALPRPEASVAIIARGGNSQTVSLSDESAMATLVMPDDVINVSGGSRAATRFVYVGGDVASRGEKEFRDGMTLTQVILSAGGVTRGSKTSVRVARRDANGFLRSSDYNLQSIEEGKTQDPLLQTGDRVEVTRGM